MKWHFFPQFYQFRIQTTVSKRSSSGGFVNPMKNGTKLHIQLILFHFIWARKIENCKIPKFHRFRMPITADNSYASAIFVFPSKNGTRLYIQILLEVSFGLGKPVISKLYFFYD